MKKYRTVFFVIFEILYLARFQNNIKFLLSVECNAYLSNGPLTSLKQRFVIDVGLISDLRYVAIENIIYL